jgi:hypothetical protein
MTKRKTTDALEALLYNFLQARIIAGDIEGEVQALETMYDCLEVEGPLGEYANALANRIRAVSARAEQHVEERRQRFATAMQTQAAEGPTGCPVGPPGPPGPGGDEEWVTVATEKGSGYQTRVGDPDHDTPVARLRGILAKRCTEAGLSLANVYDLRDEANRYLQEYASARPLPRTAEQHAEFAIVDAGGLFPLIEAYLRAPTEIAAQIIRGRAQPLLVRIGKEWLLDEIKNQG